MKASTFIWAVMLTTNENAAFYFKRNLRDNLNISYGDIEIICSMLLEFPK